MITRFVQSTLVLATLFVGSWYLWRHPVMEPVRLTVSLWDNELSRWWREKEIRVAGTHTLSDSEVLESVSVNASVATWHLNGQGVTSLLSRNPWVRNVTVRGCEGEREWSVRCFTLDVDERAPLFVSVGKEGAWLIADDGTVLEEEKSPERTLGVRARYSFDKREVPRVVGLMHRDTSPEVMQGRLRYMATAMQVIQSSTDLDIEQVKFESNGELTVRFYDHKFTATFDFVKDDLQALRQEGNRLRRMLSEFKGDLSRVEAIDLAFNKIAVVKFSTDLVSKPKKKAK